uniref:Aspartic acid-rich protein n=1 Tax=Zea mays TaxID=4577 RepID=B6UB30_MAIZE|nr:aspartic acid-rich protein [Zea mays]
MAAPAPHVAVVAAVLLLLPSLLAVVAQTPKGAKAFCISQFAIASQACSILPPSPPDEHHHDDDEDDDDNDDEHHDRDRRSHHAAAMSFSALVARNNGSHGVVSGNRTVGHHQHQSNRTRGGRGRGRGRGRHGRLRDDGDNHNADDPDHDDDHDDNDDDHDDDDDHHDTDDPDHDDDHDDDDDDDNDDDDDDHDHHDEELRAYRDCCRWLKEVQKDCVCEALLRLPPFLVKPQHTYVVRVGRTCKITYRCGGV